MTKKEIKAFQRELRLRPLRNFIRSWNHSATENILAVLMIPVGAWSVMFLASLGN